MTRLDEEVPGVGKSWKDAIDMCVNTIVRGRDACLNQKTPGTQNTCPLYLADPASYPMCKPVRLQVAKLLASDTDDTDLELQSKVRTYFEDTKKNLCEARPDMPSCKCYNRSTNPFYLKVQSLLEDVGQTAGDDRCWWRPCKFQGASNVQMIPNDMTNFEEGHMPPLTGCTGVQCLNITSLDNVAVGGDLGTSQLVDSCGNEQVETDREPPEYDTTPPNTGSNAASLEPPASIQSSNTDDIKKLMVWLIPTVFGSALLLIVVYALFSRRNARLAA